MYLLCIVLIVIVSVLMCGIVLIQNSKGGGLASAFASSNQMLLRYHLHLRLRPLLSMNCPKLLRKNQRLQ